MTRPLQLLLPFAALSLASTASAQNDECATAAPISFGVSTPYDTTTATPSAPTWPCAGGGAADLWYVITPTGTGTLVAAETCGSGYDTALQFFAGTCNGLTPLSCNDDACGLQSRLQVSTSSTAPLYLRVGGYAGGTGSGTLLVTETVPQIVSIVDTLPGSFLDISATGTPLNLSDDGEVDIPTTVGNSILAAGIARVGSNGGVRFNGTGSSLGYSNFSLPSPSAFSGHRSLLPFWDDIDTNSGSQGQIYWQEIGGTLIVQWEDAEFFPGNTGGLEIATFQLKVFSTGSAIAQFIYQDIEGARAASGTSATVGFQSEDPGVLSTAEYSYNTAALTNGDVLTIVAGPGGAGGSYCQSNPNSTGVAGAISATGSTRVVDNDLTLTASQLPFNSFGLFILSRQEGFMANPNGSQGNLCLSGLIGRYVGPGQIQNTFTTGEISLPVDLTALPQPNGFVAASPGDTWRFQAWYRDANPTVASNFTDAIAVTFQ